MIWSIPSPILTFMLSILAVTVLGLLAAVAALFQSRRALQTSIPVPEIRLAGQDFIILRMKPTIDHQFGIAKLRAPGGSFLAQANVRLVDLKNIFRSHPQGYSPLGQRFKAKSFNPPAVSVLARVTPGRRGLVKILVTSRTPPRAGRWITLSVNRRPS
jgi:hypothetical protein